MTKATKTKAKAPPAPEIETVYVPGAEPPAHLVTDLERGVAKAWRVFAPTKVDEAVLIDLKPGVQLLLTRWHPQWHSERIGPHRRKNAVWQPVLRLDRTAVGSREVVFGRPWAAGITPELMALAENEFDRVEGSHNLGAYLAKARQSGKTAHRVEVDAVVKRHSRRITFLWIRYRGLWASAGRWQSGAVIEVSEAPPPRGGQAHPNVPVV